MGRLYRLVGWCFRTLAPRMTTTWAEPFDGEPCIFVVNHAGALGPMHMECTFPLWKDCHVCRI